MDSANTSKKSTKYSAKQILRFLIPSAVGALLFMCPIPDGNGSFVIPITVVNSYINSHFSTVLPYLALIIICISALGSILGSVFKVRFIVDNKVLNNVFVTKWYWILFRCLGAILTIMVFFGIGPDALIGKDTGAFVFYSLICTILAIAFYGCGLLPLLTEFGLMEFIGTLLSPFMRKLFRLPGRAAVDCLSSWLGATSFGVIITNGQLEKGYYTEREAASIATNFSAVSIAFALVVLTQVGLENQFFPFYLTVLFVGFFSAIIINRIPPLSRKPDTYLTGEPAIKNENAKESGKNIFAHAFDQAIKKANDNGYTVKSYLTDWARNTTMMWFSLISTIMFVGTIALLVAYYTPVFTILGAPFKPLLQLLQVPEAAAASKVMVAGFTDMFIPAVVASATITSPYTLFLVAVVSITQVLYLSDNVAMILSTKINASLLDMFIIFLERTVISIIVASLVLRFIVQVPLV